MATGARRLDVVLLVGLALLIIPIVELAIIIQVGSWLGVWPTIGLLILVSVLGAWLVKHEGIATLRRVQGELAEGRLPGSHLVDGALILVAGVLMLIPGFLTDALGLLLLLPPTRAGARSLVVRRLRGQVHTYTFGRYGGQGTTNPYGRSGAVGEMPPGGDVIDI